VLACYHADPDDALITYAFLRYASPGLRKQKYGTFLATHPWFNPNHERDTQTVTEVHKEIAERKAYELEGEPKEVTLRLSTC